MLKALLIFSACAVFLLLALNFTIITDYHPTNGITVLKIDKSEGLATPNKSSRKDSCCHNNKYFHDPKIDYQSRIINQNLEYKIMYLFFPYLKSNRSDYIRCYSTYCSISFSQSIDGDDGKINATVLALSVGAYNEKLKSNGFYPVLVTSNDIKYANGKAEFDLKVNGER